MVKKVERLVQNLIERGILQDRRLIRAFLKVPLERFIPKELTDERRIYQDIPQLFYMRSPRIRRTISAPHMICIMLQSLLLEENDNLLILGSKSGYISAIASHLCPGGEIFIIESIKELVDITRENLDKTGFGKNISIIHSNVVYGMKESSPWQKILVTGQVEKEDLDYIIYQLDPKGGMLFAPIGPPLKQDFTQIIRNGEDFFFKNLGEVIFGPLDLYEPSIDDEIDEHELPEDLPPIEFKLDLDVFDKKIRKLMERYLIREQRKRGITNNEILNTSIDLARQNSGVINIITIADHLNIEPEQVLKVLKEYKNAIIEDFGTSNIVTTIFILNEEINDLINESIKKIENILEIVTEMRNNYKMETVSEYINKISHAIEELDGPESIYGIRKLKNLVNSIRSNTILLKRIEEKISSNPKLLEQSQRITHSQMNDLEELSDHLKDLLSRFNSWIYKTR